MAYATLIASTPLDAVATYREGSSTLDTSNAIRVSHLLAYWVQIQPLGQVLGECIDGGEVLAERLWHPLRPPLLHLPKSVNQLAGDLAKAWRQAIVEHGEVDDDEFFRPQITNLLALFQHAAVHGEAVVSFLDSPADLERARRVEIPDLNVTL